MDGTMEEAGLREVFLPVLKHQGDGRLWRSVPNRRWYNEERGDTASSQEVVLLHRKERGAPRWRAPEGATSRPRPSA
jgi:hypothetical protein